MEDFLHEQGHSEKLLMESYSHHCIDCKQHRASLHQARQLAVIFIYALHKVWV